MQARYAYVYRQMERSDLYGYQSAGGVEEQVVDVGAPEFDLVAPAGAFDGLYAAVERQAPDLFISLRRQKFLHYFLREGFGVTCINR